MIIPLLFVYPADRNRSDEESDSAEFQSDIDVQFVAQL